MNRLQSLKLKLTKVFNATAVALMMVAGAVVGASVPQQVQAVPSSSVPEFVPSEGKGFWVTFLSNDNAEATEVALVASSKSAASITLSYTAGGSAGAFEIPAGGGQIVIPVDVSKAYTYNTTGGVNSKSVYVQASDTISLYAYSRRSDYFESTFVLPVGALGTEYVIQVNRRNLNTRCSYFAVVATEDGTKVTIAKQESNEDIQDNPPYAPDPTHTVRVTETLNKGDVYHVKSTTNTTTTFYNLSGSYVYADKPIAVFQADEGATVPYVSHKQNYLFEQAMPIATWGKEFVVAAPQDVTNNIIRIVTTYHDTKITIKENGKSDVVLTMDSFCVYEYPRIKKPSEYYAHSIGDLYITSTAPISVSNYIPNNAFNEGDYGAFGAPASSWVPPMRQGMKSVTLGITDYNMYAYYANVIVPTSGVSGMKLDGSSISESFYSLSGTPYSIGKIPVSNAKHQLTNESAPFIVNVYGYGVEGLGNAFFYATGFNAAPAAPELYVNNILMPHDSAKSFCNQHPGVTFKAVIDYPHDSIMWDLGEGAVSVVKAKNGSYNNRHMYGKTISQGDTTHNIRLYVFHHSPLAMVKDTDSICVSLIVHPVFYDTLKTKVAAKHLAYSWTKSSDPAFGVESKGELDLTKKYGDPSSSVPATPDASSRVAPINYGKDALNSKHKWTKAWHPEVTQIFDSLVYSTDTYGCDSIFYLQLEVVSDTIMKEEKKTVCQYDGLSWTGHTSTEGHRLWRKNGSTWTNKAEEIFSTDVAGTFEIRDTLESKVFPYPDSIHILKVTINPKPEVLTLPDVEICEGSATATFNYTMNAAAKTYDYELRNSADQLVDPSYAVAGAPAAESGTIELSTANLIYGTYTLRVTAKSASCTSVTKTATLTVNNRPSITELKVTSVCYTESEVTVTYKHIDAEKIVYSVNKGKVSDTEIAADASGKGTFKIDVTGWESGTYKLTCTPKLGECDSTAVSANFTIYKQPEVYDVQVFDTCYDEGQIRVLLKTRNDALKYSYKLDEGAWSDTTDVKAVDTLMIALPANYAVGEHTLHLKAVSGKDCESEVVSTNFNIHPLPSAELDKSTDLSSCAPCDHKIVVNFTPTNATQIKWQLTKPSGKYPATAAYTKITTNTIEIPQAQLSAPGTYTLKILGVKSDKGCEVLDVDEITFKIFDPATVTLGDIESICASENTVSVPYTTTFAAHYTYSVKNAKNDEVAKTATEQDAAASGTISLDVTDKTLFPAGTYTITLTVWNDNCEGTVSDTKSFVINPLPTVAVDPATASLEFCEKFEDQVLTFNATDADTYSYWLTGTGAPTFAQNDQAVPAGGVITITWPKAQQKDGSFQLHVTVKNDCATSAEALASMKVNNKPTIELNVDDVCLDDPDGIQLHYKASGDAERYDLRIWRGNRVESKGYNANFQLPQKEGTLSWPIGSSFPAGEYLAVMTVRTTVPCASDSAVASFTIHPTPTIDAAFTIEEGCERETATVSFTHTEGASVWYWLDDDATGKAAEIGGTAAKPTFDIDINGLVGKHTLKFKVISGTAPACESAVTATKEFTINPIPTITTQNTTAVYPVVNVDVPYTATNATTFSYTLSGSGITPINVPSATVADGKIKVNTAGLNPGTYTLKVTAADKGCEKTATSTIEIYEPTEVEIEEPIAEDVCQGSTDPITVKVKTQYANTVTLVVTIGSTEKYTEPRTFENKEAEKVENIFTLSDISGWAAGHYEVKLTAENTKTHTQGKASSSFEIYQIPALTQLTPMKVCAGTDKTVSIPYAITEHVNDSIAYRFVRGATEYIQKGFIKATNPIKLSVEGHEVGEDTLFITPKSKHGCEGEEVLYVRILNQRPTIEITATPEQICDGGAKLLVTYHASADAHTYTCTLLNSADEEAWKTTSAQTIGSNKDGEFVIPTGNLPLGTYRVVLTAQAEDGCASKPDTAEVTLKATYLEPKVRDTTICYEKDFIWREKDCEGKVIVLANLLSNKESKVLVDTLDECTTQCIPIYKLNLTVEPKYVGGNETYTLCAGETLDWYEHKISKPGTYTHRESQPAGGATHGCDLIYTIEVDQIKPVTHTTSDVAFACYGEEVNFRGKTYTNLKSGLQTLRDTLRDDKCDTAYYEMQIIVGENHYYVDNITECGSYTWPVNGETYTTSGQHIEYFKTHDGHDCDSIHVLNLTINPSYEFPLETYAIVETKLPFTVHGKTYKTAVTDDVITFKTKTGTGCDSIYHVTIIVSPLPKDTAEVTICKADAPYTWRGKDYTVSGWYDKTTTVEGKDTMHLLHLTVVEPQEVKQKVTACESYKWDVNGKTYTASGTDTYTVPSKVNGCDSIIYTLNLTIDHPEAVTKDATVCQGKQTQVGNRLDTWNADGSFTEETKKPSGCIITTTYNVHVVPVDKKPVEHATICQGDKFPWRGQIYTEGGIYGDTIWDGSCPKEIYTLELTANKSYKGATETKETAEVHEDALPYKWEGHKGDTLLMTDGDYYDRLTSIDGCDSIVHLHFHVGIVERDTVHKDTNPLRGCQSVEWKIEGRTYTFTESHMGDKLASDTVWKEVGGKKTYDKIHYCSVEVFEPYEETEQGFSVCQNEEFTWHGKKYTLDAEGYKTLTCTGKNVDPDKCDSTFTVTVYVNKTLHETKSVTVCPSELPYMWAGHKGDTLLYTSGTYTDKHTSISGCDSTYVIKFTVKDVTPGTKTAATICQNNTYTWKKGNETLLTITGNELGIHEYYNEFTSNGCTMNDTLLLTVVSPTEATLTEDTICYGQHYEWKVTNSCNGKEEILLTGNFTSDVDRYETLHCGELSCDPIYHLVLHVRKEYAAEVYRDTLCPNGQIIWRGKTITKADTYEDIVEGVAEGGCDSVYRAIIADKPTQTINQTRHACQGETVIFGKKIQVADKSTILRDTIFDRQGCDSVYLNLTLNVSPYSYDSVARTECGSYTWPVTGETYDAVGTNIIRHEERDEYDCVVAEHVLRLTIEQKPEDVYENYSVFVNQLPFTVRNQTYTAAVTDAIQLVPVVGGVCDTTVHITITVSELPKDTLEATICASELPYTWRGKDYTAGGWDNRQTTVDGKDTIHLLHLTVNPTYDLHQTESSCGDFVWEVDGKTYSASGDYIYPTKTVGCNCDSIVTLHLTVGQPTTGEVAATACENDLVTFGKASFLAVKDTTFKDTIMNSMHCDSVITYTITVVKPTRHEVETGSSFCEGESFPWRGKTLTTGGLHYDTVFAGSCASEIYAIDLTMNEKFTHAKEDVQIPEQLLPYEWHGQTLTETGDYTAPYTTVNGCDSSFYIHFHVNMIERITDEPLTACDSVQWRGHWIYESGLKSDTAWDAAHKDYKTIYSCDITINKSNYLREDDIRVCQGAELTWHGQTPSTATPGTFTLRSESTTVEGCADVIEATLYVDAVYNFTETKDLCPADLPYEWTGHKADTLLRTGGVYVDKHQTINGCDSTYTLTFNVAHVTEPDTTYASICQEQTYTDWKAPIYGREPGTFPYFDWYLPDGECDSTYHLLLLTVDKIYDEGKDTTVHVCKDGIYNWYGIDRAVDQIEANLQPDGTYLQVFDTVKTSVYGCDSLEAHLTLVMHMPQHIVVTEKEIVCNSIEWGTMTITETGSYDQTFTSMYGCNDSTVTREFIVYHSGERKDTITACDSYYWPVQQKDLKESGDYEERITHPGILCDSVYYLHLTINKSRMDTIPVTWCEPSYKWGDTGETYTASGYYKGVTTTGDNGCDLTHVLKLELPTLVNKTIDTTACNNFIWKGANYPTSTVIKDTVTTADCDSIIYTTLNVTVLRVEDTEETINACGYFEEGGVKYTANVDLPEIRETLEGCQYTHTRHIVVSQPDTINYTLTGCESVTWKGETFDHSQQVVREYLCESVVIADITINHRHDSVAHITEWDQYTWADGTGETYTESGKYTFETQTTAGCDSLVTLYLTINRTDDSIEVRNVCEEFFWDWTGITYEESGEYRETKHVDDRDSTRILQLTVNTPKYTAMTDTACDIYTWYGVEYTESGTYLHSSTENVCLDVDTLHLTINYTAVPVEYYDTACDVLTINGKSYYESTTFTEHLLTENGCDSTVNYHLTINKRQVMPAVYRSTCGTYTWEGTEYDRSGNYSKVLTGANGCDSVVTLVLSVFPSFTHEFNAVSCEGHYVWDNTIYETEGDHERKYESVNGCDSIVTMHLSLPKAVEGTTVDVTACDEYWWFGERYTETGSYTHALTSITGCDSIEHLHLNIGNHPTGEFTETAQERFTWRGETYYTSGDYQQTFTREEGCDSIVTLHLTITNPLPVKDSVVTTCDAFTLDTETFYESGTYTRNFPTADGRDSIISLQLVINHDTAVTVSAEACGQYIWNDKAYDESGTYYQVLQRGSGCDSTVTLNLTIYKDEPQTLVATARDVYTWSGETFTESGTYTRSITTEQGCESTTSLILTIISNTPDTIEAKACHEYAWADSVYTKSTIHSHVFPATNGSDSIVTLSLEINEPKYTDLYDTVTVCDPADPQYSATYTLPWGTEVGAYSAIYYDTLTSAITECDSIVRFHLQWCDEPLCIDTFTFYVNDVCDSYIWEGQEYTTSGSYERHYRLENGCDSVSQLRLDIRPKAQHVTDLVACDSLYWANTDTWYFESGFYYDILTAANGCDSLEILHAVIGHAAEETIEINSCDALTINGETLTESGEYVQHLMTVTGCDSTLTINLTIHPSIDTTATDTACDTYQWHALTLTETGFYPQVLTSEVTGCDSIVDLHLIVYGSKQVDVIDSLHCDSIIWGDEHSGIDTLRENGIYTKTFLSTVGCDSTVTMDLRLLIHDDIIAEADTACDSLIWNDRTIFTSGLYKDTLTNIHGCDSIVTMDITINPTIRVEINDTVPPPFYLWPTENDTIWKSGDYVDAVPSFLTGCDSITTLHLVMTDSIVLDSIEPVRIDTFGYCPGDTANLIYNLLKGHPTKYTLLFTSYSAVQELDPTRHFISVTDTTDLPNHGQDSLFILPIPEYCEPGVYCAQLQLFDDYSSSEVYDFCLSVSYKGAIVSMWTDVVAINNHDQKFIGYQWYKDDELIPGATKQYYSDGEDLNACYRAKVQLAADSSWIFTCEVCFDLRTDSLELIAYPTPAPVGQPVTIKALGILLEKLPGSILSITNVQGLPIKEFTLREGERGADVELPAGLYIATLVTGENDDRGPRRAIVKFTVF